MRETLVNCIKRMIKEGKLKEPFMADDVKQVCPGFADKTYKLVLVHHRKGNPINRPEIFKRDEKGRYCLL